MTEERLAISYSDGSFNVLTTSDDLEKARREREFIDINETEPAHLSNIVRVCLEVIETIEMHRKEDAA